MKFAACLWGFGLVGGVGVPAYAQSLPPAARERATVDFRTDAPDEEFRLVDWFAGEMATCIGPCRVWVVPGDYVAQTSFGRDERTIRVHVTARGAVVRIRHTTNEDAQALWTAGVILSVVGAPLWWGASAILSIFPDKTGTDAFEAVSVGFAVVGIGTFVYGFVVNARDDARVRGAEPGAPIHFAPLVSDRGVGVAITF